MLHNLKKSHQSKAIGQRHQQGAILIIFTLVLLLAGSIALFSFLDSNGLNAERAKKTAMALGEAKAALIGYATATALTTGFPRPGDMPCPDTNDDGVAEASCGNAAGTTLQANRLGRFPWKTLGTSDLRDGYGERLWYAVSNNFKNNTRTTCTVPGQTGCLNSDTGGTITLRNNAGVVINNGSVGAGVAAIIFSPGPPITRSDGIVQDRGCGGCTVIAANYLDILVGTDDNASFVDGSGVDGFIQGPIVDANGATIVNDAMAIVTTDQLMPLLEKRVAAEALNCLKDYALNNPGGVDRHPWSTDLTSFADIVDHRFGRIPDTPFTSTQISSSSLMAGSWTGNCNIASGSGWWVNWKEFVFYAVAWDKDPSDVFPSPGPSAPPCDDGELNDCLTVTTLVGSQNHKKVTVIVAGKTLAGQARGTTAQKQVLSNYLEGDNVTSTVVTRNPGGEDAFFEQKPATSAFNDTVVFY